MFRALIVFLLVTALNARGTIDNCVEIKDPLCIIQQRELNENIKSNKGWIRLLNSESKMRKHGIVLSQLEINILKDYFRNKSNVQIRILR